MISQAFRFIILSSASIFSVLAVSCDFCPEGETNSGYCSHLLDLAREGKLYEKQEECDFNIPILNKRCGCKPIVPPHTPCDPCGGNPDSFATTISNPAGTLTVYESEYSCTEMLFSARNGGVDSSNCAALSMTEGGSPCGKCIETVRCDVDQSLCRPSQKLVASKKESFPGSSGLWSTALTCDDLITQAREGTLLSSSGCDAFKSIIDSTFRSGVSGANGVDLSACGLQCDFDESSVQIQGRFETESGAPSLQPSQLETLFPSSVPSEMLPPKKPKLDRKKCLPCDVQSDSAFYLYKDFGPSGTTFFEALNAPQHQPECKDPAGQCDIKELLYPDLENCYLAGVTTFDDLIGIQAVIPPEKSAYVALYKDAIAQYNDAKSCSDSLPDFNCETENLGDNETECAALKMGWFNYGSKVQIPSSIWSDGQLSYCFSGPIKNAAAVWPVEPNGYNYGDMRDVNAGWKLPGAVYKCCKSLQTCASTQ